MYRRIGASLKPEGVYIEGDFTVTQDLETRMLREYWAALGELDDGPAHFPYHLDIPVTKETTTAALYSAGFGNVSTQHDSEIAYVLAAEVDTHSANAECVPLRGLKDLS